MSPENTKSDNNQTDDSKSQKHKPAKKKPATSDTAKQTPATQPEASTETGAEVKLVAEPKPAPAAGARSGQPLAIVALLVAVGVAVGGYFIWHEVKRLNDWQQQTLGQIDSRSQSLDQRIDSFKDRLDSDLAATERSRRALEAEQRDLTATQESLENSMTVLRAQLGRSQNDWSLAEVQYLLQVANQRLQLQRDVLTATAALKSADQRLQELADPGFNTVREQIASEIAALQAVAQPDLPGISLALTQLAARVEALPLKDSQPLPQFEPAADSAAATDGLTMDDWKRLPGIIWEELKRLVVVRRNDEPVGPMLAPDQRYFLYQNLRLQLDAARLAALQGAQDSYAASLNMAGAWLSEYFDVEAAPVSAVQSELARLVAIDVRPELPDISASLRALKQQLRLSGLAVDAAKQKTGKQPAAKPAGENESRQTDKPQSGEAAP